MDARLPLRVEVHLKLLGRYRPDATGGMRPCGPDADGLVSPARGPTTTPPYCCFYPCPYCTLTPPLPSRAVDEWIALEARTEDDEVAGDVFLKACPSSRA